VADLPDIQLPVFPFRVNWREAVTERLEWKTDVMASDTGNEQRQAGRLSPRRAIDATLTLFDRERTFLDLWLHRMLNSEVMFPLWHDATPLTGNIAKAAVVIPINTLGLDFVVGGLAIIFGPSAFENETVTVTAIGLASITISAPGVAQAWRKGAKIAPLRRGFYSNEGAKPQQIRTNVWEVQSRFEINRANDYSLGVDSSDVYLGLPVMKTKPDSKEDVDYDFLWNFEELDNQTGRRVREAAQGRAMVGQHQTYLLRGREEKMAFRQFLYRQQGRLGAMWMPTFADDLTLAVNAANGQGYIDIEQCGYRYTGGATSGRNHILIDTPAGKSYHEITGIAYATIGGRERLLLNPVLPRALTLASVRSIQFMDTARIDADSIEMSHVTDADGVTTVQVPYRTFRNERTAPGNDLGADPGGGDAGGRLRRLSGGRRSVQQRRRLRGLVAQSAGGLLVRLGRAGVIPWHLHEDGRDRR
jgi:hypothetical protein